MTKKKVERWRLTRQEFFNLNMVYGLDWCVMIEPKLADEFFAAWGDHNYPFAPEGSHPPECMAIIKLGSNPPL